MSAAAFYKADDVAFVKMIGEFLYDAAQLVCLDTETAVVEYMALFLRCCHGVLLSNFFDFITIK